MKSYDSDARVLYCDNHLLLLQKPAGWLTQPNDREEESLEAYGKRYIKTLFSKPGAVFLEAVHRLDRPASGIVLFARTTKALVRLHEAQRNRLMHKEYMALVEGDLVDGEWEDGLIHGAHRAVIDPLGKRAHLSFRVLHRGEGYTLVSILLHTGRYHQIRAQFAHRGHPLLGDNKYGSTTRTEELFLHHASLSFSHPVSQDRVICDAPLPDRWQPWIAGWPMNLSQDVGDRG